MTMKVLLRCAAVLAAAFAPAFAHALAPDLVLRFGLGESDERIAAVRELATSQDQAAKRLFGFSILYLFLLLLLMIVDRLPAGGA